MASKNKRGSGGFVLVLIFLALIVIALVLDLSQIDAKEEACIKEGWDSVVRETGVGSVWRCYEDVPHESGTGTERVYSGVVE